MAHWARERGLRLEVTRLFAGEPPPETAAFDLLAVLGGPMGVGDAADHPWMAGEMRLVEAAVRAGKGVLGVCLGAQILAHVLGAAVRRNPHREIGWFPVTLTPEGRRHPLTAGLPETFEAFHWHGETFDIPAGAEHLASSEACRHQAFALGPRVIGLQFHLETTPAAVERLVTHCADELDGGPWVQAPHEMAADPGRFSALRGRLDALLDAWAAAGAAGG
nr:type 1 glutamine amidotransferase [Dissulfurirhabdus thermomarina]